MQADLGPTAEAGTGGRSVVPAIHVGRTSIQEHSVGTRSDIDGKFRLANVQVGNKTVSVRMIGYAAKSAPVSVVAGQTVTVDLPLTVQPMDLDAVVVTGQGGEISKRRIATTVDVISSETMDLLVSIA